MDWLGLTNITPSFSGVGVGILILVLVIVIVVLTIAEEGRRGGIIKEKKRRVRTAAIPTRTWTL